MTTAAGGRKSISSSRVTSTESLLDCEPPSHHEAELGLLGCVLLAPEQALDIRVTPEDFTHTEARQILTSMLALRGAGKPVDTILLLDQLVRDHGDTKIHWTAELHATQRQAPTPGHFDHYQHLVIEHSRRRAAIQLGKDLIRAGFERDRSAHLIDKALERLRSVGIGSAAPPLERLTSEQLDEGQFQQNYLIRGIVPEGQGGILSGRFKTLKTATVVDLGLSLATGTSFLNQFEVPNPARCGIVSAESGKPALRAQGRRVAASKGFNLRDADWLYWSTSKVSMTTPAGLEQLERFIEQDELKLLVCDPTYLLLSGVGDFSSNVFAMGAALEPITRLIERTGCGILLVNHNTKSRGHDVRRFDPPELNEISMSGFAEWARFWILLGPRKEWNEELGEHHLWLRVGGSAGHARTWAYTAIEGGQTDQGRQEWNVTIESAGRARARENEQAERRRSEAIERKDDDHRRRLLGVLLQHPEGETKSHLRSIAKLNPQNFERAIAALMAEARAEPCSVIKCNQTWEGFRPTEPTSRVPQPGPTKPDQNGELVEASPVPDQGGLLRRPLVGRSAADDSSVSFTEWDVSRVDVSSDAANRSAHREA